jgi:hypothetical protein
MGPADQPHQPDPRTGRADRADQVRDQAAGRPLTPARIFRFSQLEFPWALGPDDGRYVVRDGNGETSHVLVLSTEGAPERRRLRGRRPRRRKAPPGPGPTPVPTARATIIEVTRPFAATEEAAGWLRTAGEAELAADLALLNRVLHAHRIVAADPHVNAVSRTQALVARVGFGSGEEVADGQWTDARVLVPGAPRERRVDALTPNARLASVLGGRDSVLASEELALRARLDLEHGREREAALQVLVALDAALAELQRDPASAELARRVDELRAQRDPIAHAAQAALGGALSEAEREDVAFALERIESALRARAAASSR